ncbi:hypothetical protein FHS16_004855 [Paenibacillus endophyticus]|uniref:Glycosyltransferase n=1 Tax=Paenibacillus endophyticus TaxID=1294268 RepID=A0A7W5CBQ4_9BACL|nr:glycosyltransferase [Paenibacillus endophyticus]MBB3154773.1 hypothetical protein [Paenibacillus endophyticus]
MRDSMPRRMIQQQMYARERRGIFRSTEGYDTIAKSSGLDPSFIKKMLHPYCVYDAPTELAARGEKDEALYPETMHLLHLENGDVLLGRSIYQAADFTGLRSAFFTHNYLIPHETVRESADDYKSWLKAAFTSSYQIDNGMELPELSSLPVQAASAVKPSNRSLLSLLNMGEKPFKQLLYAVMSAVSGKKKMYVSLDVPIAQLPEKALQLLHVLYASLPYAYRNQLGFITYAKEPQSRKSIHLTFVEQGSLRPGDRSIEKDYAFDFVSGRISNVELDGVEHPFLDFAWNHLDNPEHADRFFQFAESMLAGMDPARRLAAASYHELSVLYQIEEGNEALYEAHKPMVLRVLLDYLRPAGALDTKLRLNDVMLSRFDYEFDRIRQGFVPEAFIVEAFKDYYVIDRPNIESKLVTYFVHALNDAGKRNGQETIDSIYAAVESNLALSQAFFAKLLFDRRLADRLLLPYIEKKLGALTGAKSVLEQIESLGSIHPALFGYESFQELARQQLASKLERERYSITTSSKVLTQLSKLAGEARTQSRKQPPAYPAADLYELLELAVYRGMLSELNLEKLTKDQLGQATFLSHKDQLKQWENELSDPRQKSSAQTLLALYDWLMLPEPTADLFGRLAPSEVSRVQQAGRRMLSDQLELKEAPRLTLAFLSSSDLEAVDYAGLIDYWQQHAHSKELIYRFFQWTEKEPDFIKARGFVPAYAAAVVGYFKKHDRNAFKKRTYRKLYFEKAGPALKAVYKQAERELASPLAKLFRQNRKGTLITSLAAIGIVLVTAGIMFSLSDKGDSKNEEAILPGATPTAEAGSDEPDTLVYAEHSEAAEGEEASTSLVFLFKDGAACAAFAPNTLKIQAPSAEAVEYKELELLADCADTSDAALNTVNPDGTEETTGSDGSNESNGSDLVETDAPISPAATPSETPITDGSSATGNQADAGETTDSATDTSPQPSPSSTADTLFANYESRVVIQLGKQVEIPGDSAILIGETEYRLTKL